MQNLKYHSINIAAITLFSLFTALAANQIIGYFIAPLQTGSSIRNAKPSPQITRKSLTDYKTITDSGFFKVAEQGTVVSDSAMTQDSFDDLTLMGTITGPHSIARALIKKKSEKSAHLFGLINSAEISNNVYGYRLVKIDDNRVYLTSNGQKKILDLFTVKKSQNTSAIQPGQTGESYQKINMSRAEIKQKVFSNMDNALQGLSAMPNRVGDKIDGYTLVTVRPTNILYRFGARSGDIVKRVNGNSINSTEKLYSMWESIKNDSKIVIDIDRNGKIVTYDFTITD